MMTPFYLDSSECYEWYLKIGMFENNCFRRKTNKTMIILLTFRRNTCMGNVHLVLLYISSIPHRECRKKITIWVEENNTIWQAPPSPLSAISAWYQTYLPCSENHGRPLAMGEYEPSMQHCCLFTTMQLLLVPSACFCAHAGNARTCMQYPEFRCRFIEP